MRWTKPEWWNLAMCAWVLFFQRVYDEYVTLCSIMRKLYVYLKGGKAYPRKLEPKLLKYV